MATAPVTADDPPIFYTLPAELIDAGMSTADGQDVLDVAGYDGWIHYHVYTPADDPDQDNENRCGPEVRMARVGKRVDMALFCNTDNDGSTLPEAIITT